jgi:hypothetical protein
MSGERGMTFEFQEDMILRRLCRNPLGNEATKTNVTSSYSPAQI